MFLIFFLVFNSQSARESHQDDGIVCRLHVGGVGSYGKSETIIPGVKEICRNSFTVGGKIIRGFVHPRVLLVEMLIVRDIDGHLQSPAATLGNLYTEEKQLFFQGTWVLDANLRTRHCLTRAQQKMSCYQMCKHLEGCAHLSFAHAQLSS